jgi:RimJ/RimL family protein N-acetyltransferase
MALDAEAQEYSLLRDRKHQPHERRENENRGFWLGLPWQGQGLMSEACNVVTDYWFDTLGFAVLRVPKAAANIASRRISEKKGMRIAATEEREYVSGRLLTEINELFPRNCVAHSIRQDPNPHASVTV